MKHAWIDALTKMGIILLILAGMQIIISNALPKALDCGEGWTGNITGKNCYLTDTPNITKPIPSKIGQSITYNIIRLQPETETYDEIRKFLYNHPSRKNKNKYKLTSKEFIS